LVGWLVGGWVGGGVPSLAATGSYEAQISVIEMGQIAYGLSQKSFSGRAEMVFPMQH
jgi:hypothetical protein